MQQQYQTHRASTVANLGATIGRRSAAALGIFVFVVATDSTIAEAGPHRTLLDWTQTPIGRQSAVLNDIDAHPAATWAVGSDLVNGFEDQRPVALRWDGERWAATPQPMVSNSTLESVAVAGADDVWAVGEDRTDPSKTKPLVMHWDGSEWKIVPGPGVSTGSFEDVKVGPDGAVWMTGWTGVDGTEQAVVYRYADGSWQPLTAGLEQSTNGNALAVISKNDVWLALNGGLAHYEGERWKLMGQGPSDGTLIPTALAAAGPNDIWAVGLQQSSTGDHPFALHYDGLSWTQVAVPRGEARLYDVALRDGQPIAVGVRFELSGDAVVDKPTVLKYRGSRFEQAPSPTTAAGTLTSADFAEGRLWAAGLTVALPEGEVSAFAAFAK